MRKVTCAIAVMVSAALLGGYGLTAEAAQPEAQYFNSEETFGASDTPIVYAASPFQLTFTCTINDVRNPSYFTVTDMKYTGSAATYTFGGVPRTLSWNEKEYPVKAIGSNLCYQNDKINVINIQDSNIETIGTRAFSECKNVQRVYLPDTIKTIGSDAFRTETSLEEVVIPDTTETIEDHAFSGAKALYKFGPGDTEVGVLHLPTSLKKLEYEAFWSSSDKLTTVEIPKSLKTVTAGGSEGPFRDRPFTTIIYESGIDAIPAHLFSTTVANSGKLPSVMYIPSTVKTIGDDAFRGQRGITKIVIEEGSKLETIGYEAFCWDNKLESINLPQTLTTISEKAFKGCTVLRDVEIPEAVTTIGKDAFLDCAALESIVIPEGLTSISDSAFSGCSSLTEVFIPKNVTTIYENAFSGCTGLKQVSFEVHNQYTTKQLIYSSAFKNCTALTDVNLGNRVKVIEKNTFQGCSALKEISIPYGVTEIEKNAFYKCINLEIMFVPSSVTKFGTTETEFERSYQHQPKVYVEKGNSTMAEATATNYGWEVEVGIYVVDEEFPDKSLNTAIYENGIDSNIDTRLTLREIEATMELSVPSKEINDMTGLQLLTSLEKLDVSDNNITELNLAALLKLKELDCSKNGLTILNLENNPLEKLNCSENAILAIDLSVKKALNDVTLGSQTGTGTITSNDYYDYLLDLQAIYGSQFSRGAVSDLKDDCLKEGEEAGAVAQGIAWNEAYHVPDEQSYTYTAGFGQGGQATMSVTVVLSNAGIKPDSAEFRRAYPDAAFRDRLAAALDTNKNGLISRTEERHLSVLDVSESSIESIKGVERLTALKELNVKTNDLSELPVSENKELVTLNFEDNLVSTIDLSANTALETLLCANNRLKKLDLAANTALKRIEAGGNALAALDVSAQTSLEELLTGKQRVVMPMENSSEAMNIDLKAYDAAFVHSAVISVTALDENGAELTSGAEETESGYRVSAGTSRLVYTYRAAVGQPVMTVTIMLGNTWELSAERLHIKVGEPAQLTVYYGKTVENGVTWISSSDEIATVSARGLVTGVSAGITTISAAIDEDNTLVCRVTVEQGYIEFLDSDDDSELLPPAARRWGETVGEVGEPVRAGYIFVGWYTGRNGTGTAAEDLVLKEDWTLYAYWIAYVKGQLTVAEIGDYTYIGTAIKPDVRVYDGYTLLSRDQDYTLSYKNNIKAGENTAVAVIKGKGNYKNQIKKTFSILPRDLSDDGVISVEDGLTALADGSEKKLLPVLTFNGKVLKRDRDYFVAWDDAGDYRAAGEYQITVTAKDGGNFTGTRNITMTISDASKNLISKAKVSGIKAQTWNGSAAEPKPSAVKIGSVRLVLNRDYKLEYINNESAGVGAVKVIGLGSYVGTKTVRFNVKPAKLSGVNISAAQASWRGSGAKSQITAVYGTTTLVSGADYHVRYLNNRAVGTATAVIEGRGNFTGTVKKKFTVVAADIAGDTVTIADMDSLTAGWEKSGAKPSLKISSGAKVLSEGVDYTVTAANGAVVGDKAVVTINGTGNLTGTREVSIMVTAGDINLAAADLDDVIMSDGQRYWRSELTLTDSSGTKLSEGEDYTEPVYTYSSVPSGAAISVGQTPGEDDMPPAGTEIKVTVNGLGGYEGTVKEAIYHVASVDLNKAAIKLKNQGYSGDSVTLDGLEPEEFVKSATVKINGQKYNLEYGTDFEIVPGSYKNNAKKGTASVDVRAKSALVGGTKTVSFKIVVRKMIRGW